VKITWQACVNVGTAC